MDLAWMALDIYAADSKTGLVVLAVLIVLQRLALIFRWEL
jgi:hypothetical protein